jgi:vacuolar-type H+-ATPase subunit F/Vma7
MKKKIALNKKTIKRLKLTLELQNDRKIAPAVLEVPSNGNGWTNTHAGSCY